MRLLQRFQCSFCNGPILLLQSPNARLGNPRSTDRGRACLIDGPEVLEAVRLRWEGACRADMQCSGTTQIGPTSRSMARLRSIQRGRACAASSMSEQIPGLGAALMPAVLNCSPGTSHQSQRIAVARRERVVDQAVESGPNEWGRRPQSGRHRH